MPITVDTVRSGPVDLGAGNGITIGLVNNMPDAAFEATERQFVDLIRAARPDAQVRLVLFSIPQVPRSDYARSEMLTRYRDVAALLGSRIDGLIVTGTEPRTKNLKDEPYWATLTELIDWARENTTSTIWSCLAAHAAVLHADGIERSAYPEKLFGVFECEPAASHPMTSDLAGAIRIPHSRLNGLPEAALAECGYRILTRSADAGVDMFARQEKSFHLFFQGHPEYEATTLLREYRRDVGRFLRRERDTYPALPRGYFDADAAVVAAAFRDRALRDRREHLLAGFPLSAIETGLQCQWRPSAVGIYAKWLEYLQGRKAERRPSSALLRRAWRDWPKSAPRPAADGTAG